MKRLFTYFLIALFCFSCVEGSKNCDATIIERKRINDSTTMLVFAYKNNNKIQKDSQTIGSKVFNSDSIHLQINNDNIVFVP